MPWLRVDTSEESYSLFAAPPLCGRRRPRECPALKTRFLRLERRELPLEVHVFAFEVDHPRSEAVHVGTQGLAFGALAAAHALGGLGGRRGRGRGVRRRNEGPDALHLHRSRPLENEGRPRVDDAVAAT